MMSRAVTLVVGALVSLTVAGCGGPSASRSSASAAPTPTAPYDAARSGPTTPAAALRVRWNLLLEEHQTLAFKTSGALAAGHLDDAGAYQDQLSRNGSDLGDLVAATYDAATRDRFDAIWVAHNRALYDAAQATAVHNPAARQRALAEQSGHFVPDLAGLLAGPGMSQSTVARQAAQQVGDSATIASAQLNRDYSSAYTTLHSARNHLGTLADALAAAAVARHPQAFLGDANSHAAGLSVELNTLLQEHAYEVTLASSALLGGRTDEQTAATRALRTNTADLAGVLDDVFGSDAQRRFTTIWRAQDGYLVDYAQAAAAGDSPGAQRALQNLAQLFTPQLTTFLTALLDTPPDPLTPLIQALIASTTAVVDSQVAQRVGNAAQDDRLAAGNITQIAGRIAVAITTRAPARFA